MAGLETDVVLLKKEVKDMKLIHTRLDTAIVKITDVSNSIHRMLAVHEEKLNVPWWLLGISMVATTFSTDTPNLVTDIVRQNGVSGNWVWWIFLLTGLLTVFIYSKLWRRSGERLNIHLPFSVK